MINTAVSTIKIEVQNIHINAIIAFDALLAPVIDKKNNKN